MINKLLSIVLLITFIGSTSPKKIGKTIYKAIKSENIKTVESLILSKNEFSELMQNMDPKPKQEQIDMMLKNYDDRKKRFLDSYFDDIKEYDLSTMKVEAIEYGYHIGKPGKDLKVTWPESKDYKIKYNSSELVKIQYSVKLKDETNSYSLQFEMMNYKDEWRFINMLRPPYIQTNE
ncbi:hypothetical protein [Seonamhaeicola maritimus]|uniref:Uncharacterized protein n=1 Tax=Seonamhaeicola maritimus TaxID=2591822 RepID=A0A5C7GDZ8_9FLAO|nr:hypothetical protein [Seonamhaeicola maritimus]TXG35072.1 hypothetical protein FUA22_15035 [Seonamhaeicola maritimus]